MWLMCFTGQEFQILFLMFFGLPILGLVFLLGYFGFRFFRDPAMDFTSLFPAKNPYLLEKEPAEN